jgi:hypothetical protein
MQDILAAHEFYNRQDDGLGAYFLDCIFSEIDSLALYAGIHPKTFGYHRLLARRFPYGIYYAFEEATPLVFRILDCRRNPHWIETQLKPE